MKTKILLLIVNLVHMKRGVVVGVQARKDADHTAAVGLAEVEGVAVQAPLELEDHGHAVDHATSHHGQRRRRMDVIAVVTEVVGIKKANPARRNIRKDAAVTRRRG